MEASALSAPAGLSRDAAPLAHASPWLRLRSDEQLVGLFRSGSEDAFRVIHDRYRQRLFSYSRQMLGGSGSDAEDVMQDVFLRAYRALRADERPVSLRSWLYRVAHNRCIDTLRRPTPEASDVFEMSRPPAHDPCDAAERREDLRRLVADVRRLPDQQRSALLMREMDGMSYAELSEALGVSLQAVKSLLVRARIGLVEAIEARDTACSEIRLDLTDAFDRGVRASGLARRHLRDCDGCVEYRTQLRAVRHGLSILGPGGSGPLAGLLKLVGLGGAGSAGAASAGGGAAAGGSVLAAATTGTAAKVAAVVCCAALTAGSAVQVTEQIVRSSGSSTAAERRDAASASQRAIAPAVRAAPATAAAAAAGAIASASAPKAEAKRAAKDAVAATTAGRHTRSIPAPAVPMTDPATAGAPAVDATTGGAAAPGEDEGFGDGAAGTTTKPETGAATAPADAPGAPAGTTGGGGAATPSETAHGGPAGTAGTAGAASGSIPPG